MDPIARMALVYFFVAISLFGCRAGSAVLTAGLSPKESLAVRSKKAAIVLYRVGKTEAREYPPAQIHFVKLGQAKEKSTTFSEEKSPTGKLNQDGWRYLVLPPGSYKTFVVLPDRKRWFNQRPFSRLRVSPSQRLLYAGSLDSLADCKIKICADVVDETKRAEEIAKSNFPLQGPMKTKLMRLYESPIEKSELIRLQPIAISIFGKGGLIPARTKARQKIDGTKMLPEMSAPILTVGGKCGPNCLGILFSDLIWFGMYRADTSAGSNRSEMNDDQDWGKCIQKVVGKSQEFNPRAELHERIQERLRKQRVESSATLFSEKEPLQGARKEGLQSVLQIEVRNAGIYVRKGVESYTAYRALLIDAKANEVIFETEFTNTRKIDIPAYCREGGAELYKKEIIQELEALVNRILPKLETGGIVGN